MLRALLLVSVACTGNDSGPLGTTRAQQAPDSAWLTAGGTYYCKPGGECTATNQPGSVLSKHAICFASGDELAARKSVLAGTGHCFLSFPDCEAARGSASSCQPY